MAEPDAGGDGPGRDVRPARRRVRPLFRRTLAGWCRTSRRCCTTTPCSPGSTPTPGAGPDRPSPGASRRRPVTGCSASCGRLRAAWPPRSTRTARARRDGSTSGRPVSSTEALGPQDAAFAAGVFGVTGTGTFERRPVGPAAARGACRPRALRCRPRGPARGAGPPGPPGPGRQGRRGVERPGDRGAGRDRPDPGPRRPGVGGPGQLPACSAGVHLSGGRLARSSRDGTAGDSAGVLEDYACVAEGFIVLSGVTGEARWLALAGELLESVLDSFGDGDGGFYDTAAGAEQLIFRPADPADNATPSGTFAAAGALLSYAALTGSARHREAALAALGVLPALAGRYPRAAGSGLAVAEAVLAGPAEIADRRPAGQRAYPRAAPGRAAGRAARRRARARRRDGRRGPAAGRPGAGGRRAPPRTSAVTSPAGCPSPTRRRSAPSCLRPEPGDQNDAISIRFPPHNHKIDRDPDAPLRAADRVYERSRISTYSEYSTQVSWRVSMGAAAARRGREMRQTGTK